MSEDFQAIVRQKARELYDVCDVEGKGYITKSEMERLVEHLPLDMDQLEDVFDSLDDDKNGHLTLEEFTDGFGQFIARGMGGAPAEEDGMEKSVYGEEGDMETEEQQFNCTMRDLGAAGIFEDVDNIRELWARVRKTNPELLPSLETLLTKVSSEIRKTQSDYKNLETAMRSKNNQHDEEIRRLYDEMENQIKTEKEKLIAEIHRLSNFGKLERQKERQWREETERELQEKDRLYQETLKKQEEMTKRLAELNAMHAATAEENSQLAQEKAELEEQLEETQSSLEESQIYIEEVRKKFKDDRRARAKNALAMSEGIALEREALVRQLDVLREDNKALKDARDERLRDGDSLAAETGRGEVLHFVDGKEGAQPNQDRRGSMLGAYFGMGGMTGQDIEDDDCEFDDDPTEAAVVPMMNTAMFAEAAVAQAAAAPPRPEMASTAIETDPMPELEPPPPPPEPAPKPEVASAVVQTDREPTPPASISERDAPDGATEEEPPYEPIFNGMKAPERMFKVVFVGDSGVGKSSIIYRFCHDSFKSTFSATIGVDFQIKTVQLETHLVAMQIWDTAGQERFRSITKQYYRKADGVIIVYDVTSHASFLNVRQWLSEVDDGTDEGAIIMLLGNKIDVPREADDPNMNIVTSKTGAQLAEQHDALFFEVSAKEGDNVKEAFHKMAGFLKEKEDDELRAAIQVSANIEKKGGCCLKK